MNIDIFRTPDNVWIETENETNKMESRSDNLFAYGSSEVKLDVKPNSIKVYITSQTDALMRVGLKWYGKLPFNSLILGDAWERGDGDLEWRGIISDRVLPWYFILFDGTISCGYGVKTGASSFASWRADSKGITLILDVRSGGNGVLLNGRTLNAAEVVVRDGHKDESPFKAAQEFCRIMCDSPRMPNHPVYGGNNWYYAYGDSSHDRVIKNTDMITSYSPDVPNRPYMVIDAGWAKDAGVWDQAANGSDWTVGNERFPDMQGLAEEIASKDVRPGIWNRPLAVPSGFSPSLLLPDCRNTTPGYNAPILDPSIPENLEKIGSDMRTLHDWGYKLIKHDFTSFDIMGRWSYDMGMEMTNPGWSFYDRSQTTAEIVLNMYKVIREAVKDSLIIGCNTFGHLTAGLFELQRTGDDTSGMEWERTRKMGVNTLAFRAAQHGAFFATDADCIGLTRKVPWEMNQRWLDVLAKSGTPLFISAEPEAMGAEQVSAVKKAFARASMIQPVGEPLDWLYTTTPRRWKFGEELIEYVWDI